MSDSITTQHRISPNYLIPRNDWWTFIWRGLVVDPTAKHYRAMGNAVWLYVYLLLFAKRATGKVRTSLARVAKQTGINSRTLQRHLRVLQKGGYITLEDTERTLTLTIQKWKPLRPRSNTQK